MIYVDPITKKPIEYSSNDAFVIRTKTQYHKKRPHRYYAAADIAVAIKEFYDLELPDTYVKYLSKVPKDNLNHDGELIFRMKGYLPNIKAARLKLGRQAINYRTVAVLNLIHCPETLARKFQGIDLASFPLVYAAWSKSRVVYCLMAYFLSLPQEEKNEILLKGHELLNKEKLASGDDPLNQIPVSVEVIAPKLNEDETLL